MTFVTLCIAAVGGLLILTLSPMTGVLVYLAALCWYPQALTLTVFSIDFPTGRLLGLILLIRVLWRLRPLQLRPCWLDAWVLASHAGMLAAAASNVPWDLALTRQGGRFIDAFVPYLVMRLLITDRARLVRFIQYMVIVAAPLAVLGLFQSVTGKNPVEFMTAYYSWGLKELLPPPERRHGFYRAAVTFNIPIVFGLFFASLAPMVLGLWRLKGWSRALLVVAFGMMIVGVFSSMSSAPLFALAVSLAMVCAYPLRRWWRLGAVLGLIGMVFVEAYSNRHVYHILTVLSFNSSTAYYRAELLDEAFGGGMKDHWLTGYGYVGVGPGTDNTNFKWNHRDLTNIFVNQLACFGLLGMIPTIMIFVTALHRLYLAGRLARSPANRWLLWCFAAALVGWLVALQTVADMAQVIAILAIYFGLCGNMPRIMAAQRKRRRRAWQLPPLPAYGPLIKGFKERRANA